MSLAFNNITLYNKCKFLKNFGNLLSLQPNYVGVICVNMSPRHLIERKAEVAK